MDLVHGSQQLFFESLLKVPSAQRRLSAMPRNANEQIEARSDDIVEKKFTR